MIGLGTIVNTVAIIVCAFIGIILKNGIPDKIKNSIISVMGLSVMLMGLTGLIQSMVTIENNSLKFNGIMLITISLVLGLIVGEIIDIEKFFDNAGNFLKKKVGTNADNRFVEGFVTTSLIFCIGAMSILGAIADGINNDPSILYNKAILDGISVIIFASTYGIGAMFSALSVFVYQGTITLLSFMINDYVTPEIMNAISMVGSAMIFCLGSNIFFKTKVRVGNLLPAIFFAVLFTVFNIF